MRIGFIQPDEKDNPGLVPGYAETSKTSSDEDGFIPWLWTVFMHYALVRGFIAIVKDLVEWLGSL